MHVTHSSLSPAQLKLEKPATWLICFLLIAFPLLFGAVHPLVLGVYTFMILVGIGGWLLLNPAQDASLSLSFWWLVPLILIGYLIFQAIPLPLELVEILSPNRAARIQKVNELAGTSVQWVPLSDNGVTGLYRSFFLVSLFLYFVGLKRLMSHNSKTFVLIFWCIIGVGAFEAFYGLLQFVKPNLGVLWIKITAGRAAHGTIIYKNQYASLLNMIWPLAASGSAIYALRGEEESGARHRRRNFEQRLSNSKTQSTLMFGAAILMVLAVLFSLSRGGILTMLLVAVLLTLLLPFTTRKKLIYLGLFMVIIVGYGSMLGIDTIISRFGTISGSGETRLKLYLLSMPMVFDHWLTGIGLGSYSLLSPMYLEGFPTGRHADRVHNEYLELLIELGIPMALLLVFWLFGGIVKILVTLKSAHSLQRVNQQRVILALAATCGLIGFLAHGLVDFGWRLPANLFFATTLLAIIAVCLSDKSAISKSGS